MCSMILKKSISSLLFSVRICTTLNGQRATIKDNNWLDIVLKKKINTFHTIGNISICRKVLTEFATARICSFMQPTININSNRFVRKITDMSIVRY